MVSKQDQYPRFSEVYFSCPFCFNWGSGQHIATKVGTVIYCTTRSCVPVLRNCLVYFESKWTSEKTISFVQKCFFVIFAHDVIILVTVLPRSFGDMGLQPSMTTLSIGLSTEEMPANALVGAWQGTYSNQK